MKPHESDRVNIASDGWELESAVERNRDSPRFVIPPEAERSSLKRGARVQLLFLFATIGEDGDPIDQGERLWVTVTSAEDGQYVGRIDSQPVSSTAVSSGDSIRFRPEHISRLL
jgi:uncharacterized protein YegJ (DUF2314 family)